MLNILSNDQFLRIEHRIKLHPESPPGWRIKPDRPGHANALIQGLEPRPSFDTIHYETHVALPPALAHAMQRGHQHTVTPLFEKALRRSPALRKLAGKLPGVRPTPAALAEQWVQNNRVYIGENSITYQFQNGRREYGAFYLNHINRATLDTSERVILHSRDEEILLPPLCRALPAAETINWLLSHELPPVRTTCAECRHYQRRPVAGNQGDCALQPARSLICCPLNGHHDRCRQLSPRQPRPPDH